MRGYTTNYVNLIADNLRDRYENGFPVLKELIQNADDAKARALTFGRHEGFPHASHPMLNGPGLWFLNDGEFTQRDVEDLRSFGINSKAGDASVIGKFGLGMKSVFHLCEALFYVAWDGRQLHREGLTPWKQDGQSFHPQWDVDPDWDHLTSLGQLRATEGNYKTWFLLWLPLRMKRHLQTSSDPGREAIINRFPGDDPVSELAFLDDGKLIHDLAEVLPLLRHLKSIKHDGSKSFVLTLAGATRLMGDPDSERADGSVLLKDGRQLLTYSGMSRESPDADGQFRKMKARKEWPRVRYRDKQGYECEADDETAPQAAVLFCSGHGSAARSRLQWAVFLPVEEGSEDLRAHGGSRGHSLFLHGQLFLDAGRKRIHGLDRLHEEPVNVSDVRIDGELRTVWNQRLTQDVLLPLVLPALERHTRQCKLSDTECDALTTALSGSEWFKKFGAYVCRDACWVRTLQPLRGPRWCFVEQPDAPRLRPVPGPPRSDPERPWSVFPNLAACSVTAYDVEAPRLGDAPHQWQEAELAHLLSRVDGLFAHAPAMDYLAKFLDSCARSCLPAASVQRLLVDLLRNGLRSADLGARRQVTAKGRRLIGFLKPEGRLALSCELPEAVLKDLWEINAPVLLIPKDLDAADRPGEATCDERTLADWLRVLDRALDAEKGVQEPILDAMRGLLKILPAGDRGGFLQSHPTLRIIQVRDARSGEGKPATLADLEQMRDAGLLFHFAGGFGDEKMGMAPHLARVIPNAEVWLVGAPTYREFCPDDAAQESSQPIPAASDGTACLTAVGRQRTGRLGDLAARRELLELANDPRKNDDARRGLRLLLHGSIDHRTDDTAKLWTGRHRHHRVWSQLWDATHEGDRWSRVPDELADAVPRTRWEQANIDEIDAATLISELHTTRRSIEAPDRFSAEERDEILSRIKDADLWRQMPFHTTLDGTPVSANGKRVYLAPAGRRHADPSTRQATLIAPSRNALVETQQKRWLHPLDDRARIELALATTEPSRHWCSVMNSLGALGDEAIDDELQAVLRNTAWLPLIHGTPVKPEDVIDLPSLRDEVHRLVADHRAICAPCSSVPGEIGIAVQDHRAWETLRAVGFSSAVDGLERLGLLLSELPEYHVGTWRTQPAPDELALLSRCARLPGWWLLEMAAADPFDLDTAWTKLAPRLSKEIDAKRLTDTLNCLSGGGDAWDLRKSVYDTYLRQLAMQRAAARHHLRELRLATAGRQWQEAAKLCAGARGVAHDRLLDKEQDNILGPLICRTGSNSARRDEGRSGVIPGADESQATPNVTHEQLRRYFAPWDSSLVPAPMIAVVLALLGRDARDLSNDYLRPHSFDWLISQLTWKHLEQPARQPVRTDSQTVVRALELVQVDVRVEAGNDTEVLNLLGQPMRVALNEEADTLLVGAPRWHDDLGVNTPMPRVVALTACGVGPNIEDITGYKVTIQLRRIDPALVQSELLPALLRSTAEQLYSDLYSQTNADFSTLWQSIEDDPPIDIRIARRLILNHLPFYLRQLSVKCDGVEKQLAICDSKLRRIEEADAGKDTQSAELHRTEFRKALDDLAERIDGNLHEQQAVILAVKGRLEQYQYQPSSIPFELFQNADDAAVELGHAHTYPSAGCTIPQEARRFVVEPRDDGVRFVHWGRPINGRGPASADGERRGYDRDLEKMLILSASDKEEHQGVTGRFGLGFKSVLLVCEQPRILSGRLAIRVVSGILPQPWEDAQQKEARQRLTELGENPRLPGTLIDLPGVEGDVQEHVLERFHQLAGILCVFGQAIRSITFTAATESTRCWQPREICSRVEVGDLDLRGDWGARTTAMCVRTDSGSLLTALGPKGFRRLPDGVPALWVTAPTTELSGAGFAINGRFDLDAGRGRLTGNTANNLRIANRIGVAAGKALGALLERSRTDWGGVQAELRLATNVDSLVFWESVWAGLTTACLSRPQGNGVGLVREVALGALGQLAQYQHAIPNGLGGVLRGFTDAREIRYELSGVLRLERVGATLGAWTRFTDRYSRHNCVSSEIGDILRRADVCDPKPLKLFDLAVALEGSRVGPDDAHSLGLLWLLTNNASDWQSDDLLERLNDLLFRSEAGHWVKARALLVDNAPGLDPDEARRHALAPPGCRLHSTYYVETDGKQSATAFFLFCRQRMDAPAEKIAQWVLDSESDETRLHALMYLADGQLAGGVAELVRGKGWLSASLNDAALLKRLTSEQRDSLRRRLASAQEIRRVVGLGLIPPGPGPGQEGTPHPDAVRRVIERIYGWWRNQKDGERDAYAASIYPKSFSPSQLRTDRDRVAWFTMFALACYQSLGRTQIDQHRGFIGRGIREGWWQDLAQSRPPADVQPWLARLERWSAPEAVKQDFLPWKRALVDLYTVARHLDTYIQVFQILPRIIREHGPVSLSDAHRPTYWPEMERTGLDAAPLDRSVGIGANWMLRELVRHGVYENHDEDLIAPYCWATTRRVRMLLNNLAPGAFVESADMDASRSVYEFIKKHIGADRARFDGDFDLPLQLVTRTAYGNVLTQCFEKTGSEPPDLDAREDERGDRPAGEDADE